MPRHYLFADEAGDFNFSRHPQASRYFILCTITVDTCDIGIELMDLRRELAWDRHVQDAFHATTDSQLTRDRVFALIQKHQFRIDATIYEKCKAIKKIRPTEERFYHYAWFLHFKHVGPKIVKKGHELLITAASLGTKSKRNVFLAMLHDVAQQSIKSTTYQTVFWPAATDPCLQVADYCTWAIQRKWERGDAQSYDLIKGMIASEFDIFAASKVEYY